MTTAKLKGQPEYTREIPKLKGGLPLLGHMASFAKNPYQFMKNTSDELGEIVQFKIFSQRVILLTGDDASARFYLSSDEELDQAAAYKLMTPIFGEGVVFDAPVERKNQQLKMLMPALRMEAMRRHSDKIMLEVRDMVTRWGDEGEIELVAEMKRLTINTASHCLLGREFRYELTGEFADIYHDLEGGVNALAYNFPNLPLPSFRKRDKARARLRELVGGIVEKRASQTHKPTDMFQMLIDTRYDDGTPLSEHEITGMLIAAIFAGHHTSSGTSAWVLLELLKQPHLMKQVCDELDHVLGQDGEVTFQSVRDVHKLENVLKEVLRLHPPLIVLMRQVAQDLKFKDYVIEEGDMVWASPPVTHRMSRYFPNPEVFDPDRYTVERGEDGNMMAYQPFGGGKHKCSGNAFAMFQIKAIFSELLRKYTFELTDPPQTYVDDYHEMIVQPKAPCRVRYKLRDPASFTGRAGATPKAGPSACPAHVQTLQVTIDERLCQGHSMCIGEAPQVFELDAKNMVKLRQEELDVSMLAQVKKAALHCPNHALTILVNGETINHRI